MKAITVRAAENSVREAVSEASGEVWAGRARDAFVHTASILADDLRRLASRWDAEASALTAYARGVQAVKDQQQTLTRRRELAEGDIDGWRREQRTAERENLIPAMTRAAANRTLAARQLKAFRDAELFDPNRPPSIDIYPTGNANMIDYLQRVVDGDVQLYLWRPDKDEVIEMFGNPDTADVIMSFMPGTNTTMDSFYTATATTGITALTRWEVENADPRIQAAGFVVKQGAFPQLGGNIFATGPQNNDTAEELGAKYADFAAGIHVITPGTPVLSVEHSFGSSVGGVAETQDAGFHTRITLSGIGMTSDYGPSLDTDHYAMRSPNDILDQLHVKETQIFNWGYQHAPTPENGFTELDSGIPGTPAWAQIGKVISPPIAIGDLASGLDHHNQIISGDISENRVVLETINDMIWNAAR